MVVIHQLPGLYPTAPLLAPETSPEVGPGVTFPSRFNTVLVRHYCASRTAWGNDGNNLGMPYRQACNRSSNELHELWLEFPSCRPSAAGRLVSVVGRPVTAAEQEISERPGQCR